MIKIDDRFSIKAYKYGWELHDTVPSDNDKNKSGLKTTLTFHPNLTFIGRAMVNLSCGESRTAEELLTRITESTAVFVEKLSTIKE